MKKKFFIETSITFVVMMVAAYAVDAYRGVVTLMMNEPAYWIGLVMRGFLWTVLYDAAWYIYRSLNSADKKKLLMESAIAGGVSFALWTYILLYYFHGDWIGVCIGAFDVSALYMIIRGRYMMHKD